ncbi:DUF192 domain-containing protein [Salinicoccus sp. ID82-1]|uniref:DUF192 domain-containing protein n=1 Tax=Salinicoccus sp. ID82-1 TaxID=2820269 RepID=UPI001F24F9FE|nr:DUF192 domain-containing protein [Salinicoccus sp. ID82-1]MCG1009768.1 DUF192 domain-containing protein [Salinicoccus sp. ID82-1]
MKLVNSTTDTVLVNDLRQAYSFWSRFKGLMFKCSMPSDSALHLYPCRSIHTFFMKFSIDVIYLDEENKVVGIETNLIPGKIGWRYKEARSVIELPAGKLYGVSTGDTLAFAE